MVQVGTIFYGDCPEVLGLTFDSLTCWQIEDEPEPTQTPLMNSSFSPIILAGHSALGEPNWLTGIKLRNIEKTPCLEHRQFNLW